MNPSSADELVPRLVDVNRTGCEPPEGTGENGGWARSTRLAESFMTAGYGYHDREYRLSRCGCVLRFAHLFQPEHFTLVSHAYEIADGDVPPCHPQGAESDLLTALVNDLTYFTYGHRGGDDYFFRLLSLVGGPERAAEVAAQEAVIRDVFGNPFRPVTLNHSWLTSTVLALATGIYQEGAFDRMPILGDALQDAGCDNQDILNHCRQLGEHVRGCWVVDEVLRLRSEEVRLRRWGMTDPLTGIGGRRTFDTVLHGAIRRAVTNSSPLSVLLVDLDHFKQINNDFGHLAGDRVLPGVAVRLRDALGEDGFLARIGGDDFGAVLHLTDPAAAVGVGERLRRAVADWRFAPQEGLPPEQAVTVSIGVATLVPDGMTDHHVLLNAAHDALDRAKAGGPNRVSV